MKTKLLFPSNYKKIGWSFLIPFAIWGIFFTLTGQNYTLDFLTYSTDADKSSFQDVSFLFDLTTENFTNEIIGIGLLIGLILTAFSEEKIEDERIKHLRLESLLWAVYFNSFLILLAIIFVYGSLFFSVMTYAMFTPLIFFITRFHWLLWKEKQQTVQIIT